MERATIFGGFGGQGILFAGQVLAEAAVDEGREVSWMPSYGPEMRGGTASCTVIVADRPIGSPIVDRPDIVIALNPPSLARFEPQLASGGLILLNSSLIEAEPRRADVEAIAVPCTALAREAGDDRLTSVVALGAVIARRPVVDEASIRAALVALVARKHPELVAANLDALDAGARHAAATASGV